jgi:hypothetical protein
MESEIRDLYSDGNANYFVGVNQVKEKGSREDKP